MFTFNTGITELYIVYINYLIYWGKFVYVRVYIIVTFRLRARMLVIIRVSRISFKINLVYELYSLDYFSIFYMTKTMMLKSNLRVIASGVSWLSSLLDNHCLFSCFNI